mgnify:CR=1 FL=1
MKLYLKFINQLYKLQFFKLANILNLIISFTNPQFKKYYYLYKFYIRKNKTYEEIFLNKIFPPKIFLLKNIKYDKNILLEIKKYIINNPSNEYDLHGHKNIYQSLHDLNLKKEFIKINDLITNILNKKIITKYKITNSKFELVKLWFTITKQSGEMKKHHHLDGELSGVLYLKCDNVKNPGYINFYNDDSNLEFNELNLENESLKHNIVKNKVFKYKPSEGDLIIFDSYLNHSVNNGEDIKTERIAMPWDASLQKIN